MKASESKFFKTLFGLSVNGYSVDVRVFDEGIHQLRVTRGLSSKPLKGYAQLEFVDGDAMEDWLDMVVDSEDRYYNTARALWTVLDALQE